METQIQFKLLEEEKELIRESARRIGLGMSPFCRMACLERIKNQEGKNGTTD